MQNTESGTFVDYTAFETIPGPTYHKEIDASFDSSQVYFIPFHFSSFSVVVIVVV
jgi:hypothetical protein